MTVLVLSRCDFSTKIISSSEPPDKIFNSFITAVKNKDFAAADTYLANGMTIEPKNETGYSFFDSYVDTTLDIFKVESVGEPEYDGKFAKLEVQTFTINRDEFIAWTNKNLLSIEHEFLVENKLNQIDTKDPKDISKVLSMALKKYVKEDKGSLHVITVNYVFTGKGWKIIGSEDLIKAIFGGSANEEEDRKG